MTKRKVQFDFNFTETTNKKIFTKNCFVIIYTIKRKEERNSIIEWNNDSTTLIGILIEGKKTFTITSN